MSDGDVSRALAILRDLYPSVQTVEEFAAAVSFSGGGRPAVVEPADGSRFRSLARGLIVCEEKPLRQQPRREEVCTLPEILAYVLNNMVRKRRRNVLRFGYLFTNQAGDADPFKFHGTITQSPAFIHGSDFWRKVSQRLGTDLTQHLLQSCAVFVVAPPTCLFQVCGVPIYDRVSIKTGSSFFLCTMAPRPAPPTPQGANRDVLRTSRRRKVQAKKRKREEKGEGLPRKRRRCEKTYCPQSASHSSVQSEPPQTVATETSQGHLSWKADAQPPPRPILCLIRVLRMLYSGQGMRNFQLNRKLKGGAGVPCGLQGSDLVRVVFLQGESYLNGEAAKPKKLPRRFFSMVPLFSRLLQRHRKCPYAYFLRKKCSGSLGSPLASHCPPYRVYLFLRESLGYVVPDELWGSDQNRLLFLARVKQFLRLGKFEGLSLAQVVWRMKVGSCGWLGRGAARCPSEHRYREWILGQFLAWLLDSYVLGLVRAFFYVTESMGQKQALRFYTQQVWTRLRDQAFRELLSKGRWKPLSPQQLAALPKSTVTSRIRFIPKANGMRPITRLVGRDAATKHFQSSVRDLRDVLGVCVKSSPSLLGSTVWGRQDIHRVLKSVALHQKSNPTPLYFVKVDVSGAYDSLPHDKLLQVVSEALHPVLDLHFSIRHFTKVWEESLHGVRRQFCTRAGALESTNMKGFVMEEQQSGKLHHAVLVEKFNLTDVTGRGILQFFRQMLTSCVIRYGKRTFQQVCGVPQGFVVSAMLCNLCYGHMENTLLGHVTERGGCLMRLVDDFLLITPKLHKALTFLRRLLNGVPQYGCVVNPQKVAVNFPPGEEMGGEGVRVLPQHCLFPWCGLLVDTNTLDVSNDYSSYAGLSLRYSLTIGYAHSAASFMQKKLMSILRLKCDAIFLDLAMNSLECVFKNLYKIVLLQAMRFHVCVRALPLGQNVETNPSFFMRIIWSMVKLTSGCIQQSNQGNGVDSGSCVPYEAVELLFCLAFEVVFLRHRPCYRCLLPCLRRRKWRQQRVLRGVRLARVRQAATPRIPSDFTAIRL
ncbi:telomerase reverse transcriptase [Denticeps clupeoides]|uniref:telomerase reverse transcriptase n=1 Tax=Denticeps clupeoides TaxID=299321 RepID=UPI0010A52075|nr:telomerase reverse transcriptase [Denticeps clupeoides]